MKEPHVIVQIDGKTLDPAVPPLLPMWITPDDWPHFLEWKPHADGETLTELWAEEVEVARLDVVNFHRSNRREPDLIFDPFEFHRRA